MSAVEANQDVVLLARGISKSFPGVKALDDVSLSVQRGRVHALLGENGAGKSTLMNILAGVYPPDAGEILLDGRPVSFGSTRDAREAGVSIIFQELNLIPHLSVAQNIFLGREPLTRWGLIDDAGMRHGAAAWLRRLNLAVSPRTLVGSLRVGEQQVVEIAKALAFEARVIIMDEPTSAITEQEIVILHDLIRRLTHDGVAVVYITHKLNELPLIADELTVMRDGRCIGSRPVGAATHDDIVHMMAGRQATAVVSRSSAEVQGEVLRVEALNLAHPAREGVLSVRDVSLHLRRGEVLGLFGLMGSGRTELLETLFGMNPKRARGRVFVDGAPVSFQCPRDAIDAGVVLAPEDRKRDGLVLSLSVAANCSLSCIERIERNWLFDAHLETDLAEHYVKRLGIKTPAVDQLTRNLSGGSQQKVVLAKWLATHPKVLLLDEPTRGIDISAKREIYALIDELVGQGLGIVFVSSELPELLGVADRILVMSEGSISAEFSRAEANEEDIMRAALPSGGGGSPGREPGAAAEASVGGDWP